MPTAVSVMSSSLHKPNQQKFQNKNQWLQEQMSNPSLKKPATQNSIAYNTKGFNKFFTSKIVKTK